MKNGQRYSRLQGKNESNKTKILREENEEKKEDRKWRKNELKGKDRKALGKRRLSSENGRTYVHVRMDEGRH